MPEPSLVAPLAWLVVVVLAVVLEIVSLDLVFLMLAGGALVGGLGTWLLGLPWPLQIVGAAVVSALLLLGLRPPLIRRLHAKRDPLPTGIDALQGMSARATSAFTDGRGLARLANGETWSARLDPAHVRVPVEADDRLVVLAVDGATAVVTPAPTRAIPRQET
ncbi:NfeD family protein [Amnibacterium sp. CER49]|uniref:NfeD family protein n=1 Tax=Amnibacterium sp. CER49 TaxID=3039161 RepID=UPI00244CD078|nr:NfeD family protein [Amnibacterium sp. CER49]MDH2444650.1 NfeD family protein [Amnibacterium sp. CER49]